MSLHLVALRLRALSEQSVSIPSLLAQIQKQDPAFAEGLAQINWAELYAHIGREALREAAEELRLHFSKDYRNETYYGRGDGCPPKGICLGVLHRSKSPKVGEPQLGMALEGTTFTFFWNVHTEEQELRLQQWIDAVEKMYKRQAIHAALVLRGGTVERKELPNGTVVFEATLPARGGR